MERTPNRLRSTDMNQTSVLEKIAISPAIDTASEGASLRLCTEPCAAEAARLSSSGYACDDGVR